MKFQLIRKEREKKKKKLTGYKDIHGQYKNNKTMFCNTYLYPNII